MASSNVLTQRPQLPTLPNPAASLSPADRVASYQNQQLGGLTSGLSSTTGPVDPTATSTTNPYELAKSPVANSADRIATSISDSNARMAKMATIAQQHRLTTGKVQSYSPTSGGVKWSPTGALSGMRNTIMSRASSLIGSRYVAGTSSIKNRTFDCGGLVMAVYNSLGLGFNYQRNSNVVPGVRTNFANLRPGDLVVWKNGTHIAIYAGNGQIIEAANPRAGVRRKTLWTNPNNVFGIKLQLPGE